MSTVLSKSQMKKVTLQELKQMALDVKYSLWNQAEANNRDVKLYVHWSAGRYSQFWDDYHVQIDYDGSIYVPRGVSLDTVLAATYMRNSGSIALCFLGCFDATTNSGLGTNPITAQQVEVMSQCICVLADALNLTIDKKRVLTHGEAGDNEDGIYCHEPYGVKTTVERWDCEYLGTPESSHYNPYATDGTRGGDVLRGKANWYRGQKLLQ